MWAGRHVPEIRHDGETTKMRKIIGILLLGLICAAAPGCRYTAKMGEEFRQLKRDIDQTVFGLDDRPVEED